MSFTALGTVPGHYLLQLTMPHMETPQAWDRAIQTVTHVRLFTATKKRFVNLSICLS